MRPQVLIPLGVGAVLTLVVSRLATGPAAVAAVVCGYGLLMAFTIAERNRPGMGAVTAGLASNGLVIAVDAGMPVQGMAGASGLHHSLTPSDHLSGLADVIRLPGVAVLSAGDLMIAAGVLLAVLALVVPRHT